MGPILLLVQRPAELLHRVTLPVAATTTHTVGVMAVMIAETMIAATTVTIAATTATIGVATDTRGSADMMRIRTLQDTIANSKGEILASSGLLIISHIHSLKWH